MGLHLGNEVTSSSVLSKVLVELLHCCSCNQEAHDQKQNIAAIPVRQLVRCVRRRLAKWGEVGQQRHSQQRLAYGLAFPLACERLGEDRIRPDGRVALDASDAWP